jgi:outer membrane protein assembly factor BamB
VGVALEDGVERWRRRVNAAFDVGAPPVVGSGGVFVTDVIGHTRAFDASSGEPLWDFAQNATVFRSVPALVGTHLLVPTTDGELGAIDVATGELVWRKPADGAPLRSLAVDSEIVVGVRGGARSGIEALEHDPDGALVREPSPTTLALGRMVGAMAIAAVGVLAVVLLLGRLLVARGGRARVDPDADDAADADDDTIRDPWEDEDPER